MKLWNYLFIFTGVAIFMALAGLDVAGFSDLFRVIGITVSSEGITNVMVQSTFWNYLFSTTGLLVLGISSGAVGIGTFIYTKDKSFLMIPLITSVTVYWGSVIVSLIQQKGGYGVFGTIIAIICIAFSVGFVQACVDYFMGVD